MSEKNSNQEVKSEAPKIELTPQEQQQIEISRETQGVREACLGEINVVLQKYNAEMRINPRSEIGNPQVMILIK